MTIKSTIHGPFLLVEAFDVLEMNDLPPLFSAFEAAHRAGPFVVLTDTMRLKSAPRAVIAGFADGLKRLPPLSKTWLGDAVVVSSPAVRFVLSTLFILAPMPTQVKAFDHFPDAKRWCIEVLGTRGLCIPAELRKSA